MPTTQILFSLSRRDVLQRSALLLGSLMLPACAGNTPDKKPQMSYALALVPPPALSGVCAGIRKQFDPERSDKTFPHITLKQPFVFPDDFLFTDSSQDYESALLQATQQVCNRYKAIPVQLEHVSSFDSPVHGSVVHVQVALSPMLHALQEALTEAVAGIGGITNGLDPEQETRIYYPHLTLAQGLSREAATAVMNSQIQGVSNQAFMADTVVVGRCGADQVWQKMGSFPLAGG